MVTRTSPRQIFEVTTAGKIAFHAPGIQMESCSFFWPYTPISACIVYTLVSGMTKEHLGLSLALGVPVYVVVTKIDMCPPNVLEVSIGSNYPYIVCFRVYSGVFEGFVSLSGNSLLIWFPHKQITPYLVFSQVTHSLFGFLTSNSLLIWFPHKQITPYLVFSQVTHSLFGFLASNSLLIWFSHK